MDADAQETQTDSLSFTKFRGKERFLNKRKETFLVSIGKKKKIERVWQIVVVFASAMSPS